MPGYELGTELSRVFGTGSYRIKTRKELDCAKKTLFAISSYSKINKSVARTQLVKTEKHNACVAVNFKVCRSVIELHCL